MRERHRLSVPLYLSVCTFSDATAADAAAGAPECTHDGDGAGLQRENTSGESRSQARRRRGAGATGCARAFHAKSFYPRCNCEFACKTRREMVEVCKGREKDERCYEEKEGEKGKIEKANELEIEFVRGGR